MMSLHPNGHLSYPYSLKQWCFWNWTWAQFLAYVAESPIWNTLIPSRFELLDDVDDSDDYENEEDDDNDNDNDDDDYLSPMPIESEEADYTCWFEAFQSPCATTWKHKANWEQYN